MTEPVCTVPECTYSQTGVCMQSYATLEECPAHHALLSVTDDLDLMRDETSNDYERKTVSEIKADLGLGEAVLNAPMHKAQLPRSGTLGLAEADLLMSERYVNLIGIVGLPDAGKTACIASLYLQLAHDALEGFSYADSMTLMALEEISRGSRRWNDGRPPRQMTVHTELPDDRQAGFLHLRLRRHSDAHKFDVLMPDLPGEWSRSLIHTGDSERFTFLQAAEVIWIMVNGRDFLDVKTRELAIHRTTNLLERLSLLLPDSRPKIILVASWRDSGSIPEQVLKRVQDSGAEFGFKIELASIASFSESHEVAPGSGFAELMSLSLKLSEKAPDPWPMDQASNSHRAFLNFGKNL